MRRFLAHLTHRSLRDDGVTVVEVSLAMILVTVALGAFGPMLTTSLRSATSVQSQSENLDNLQIALTSIERELRSADCITSPAENAQGATLDFTTTANNTNYEVVYSLSGGKLTRTATPGTTALIAEHVVNTTDAFQQVATPRRTVVVTFRVQSSGSAPARSITTTVAGRNAWRTCPAALP